MLVWGCFPIPELRLPNLSSIAQPEIAELWLSLLWESSGEEQQWDLRALVLLWNCWLSCWQKGQAREFVFADMPHVAWEFGGNYRCLCQPVSGELNGPHPSSRRGTVLAGLGCVSKHPQARDSARNTLPWKNQTSVTSSSAGAALFPALPCSWHSQTWWAGEIVQPPW